MAIPDENSNHKPPILPRDLIPQAAQTTQPSTENRSNERRVEEVKVNHSPAGGAQLEPETPRPWTCKRGLCCLGWIFCLPVCCACYLIREKPVDDEDLKEDDCLPCYG